ncbi:hypothetical protein SAMN04488128_1011837 [Chitinophaga eiseniae]|uniref:Lipoprotein n=1 Tax=Chitinophaga eiseniae TaxID=634771 RepID=A0A1T4P1D9_9BACT|nr:hypothetical protein [Chitinophaga eiseniae]SJZ84768.1 hypothetical protein SAMN04488128_1011837 [Chitinophaga eiseniae]
MFSRARNNRLWMLATFVLFCSSCVYPNHTPRKGHLNGNGSFVVYKTPIHKNQELDTLENQQVTGIARFNGINYQSGFRVGRHEPDSGTTFIPLGLINRAVIRSGDNKDSLVYRRYDGNIWQVIKNRKDVSVLFRSYDNDNTWYSSYDNMTNGSVDSYYVIAVLKNDKKVEGIPYLNYSKESLLKFVNKQYRQHFKKSDFKDEDQLLEYILNQEGV